MARPPILWLAAPVLVIACAVLAVQWSQGSSRLPMRDFVEYYSAGKAFLDHRNAYDPAVLLAIQREILNDPSVEQPVMMWNPPWALVLVAPLGLLPPQIAHMLWLAVHFACVLASLAMLMRIYKLPLDRWILGFVAGLVFCPFFLLIWYGQIGGFLLLGLAGFLYFNERDRPMTAGAFAALTALKPHLLFAFGLALILDAIVSGRSRRVVLGGVLAVLAAALAVWFINPMVYAHYLDSIRAPSSEQHMSVRDWYQPLVSYWFRKAVAPDTFAVQFLPTVIASAIIVLLWLQSPKPITWPVQLPRLVFVSTLFAAYGAWIFDLVVLLVPVVQATATLSRTTASKLVAVAYIAFNLVCSVAPVIAINVISRGVGVHEFIFFTPVIFLLWWLALRRRDG